MFSIVIFIISMTIFGFQISKILKLKQKMNEKFNFTSLIQFFGIGISFYIIFEYIFITIWEINWFTGFWFFLIEDFVYLIIKRKELKHLIIKFLRSIKKKFDQVLVETKIVKIIFPFLLLVLFIVYLLGLIIIPELKAGIPEWDVVDWMGAVFNLVKNGQLRYDSVQAYPVGFLFFYSGIMNVIPFISQNLNFLYVLFKIWPLINVLSYFILIVYFALQIETKIRSELIVLGLFSLFFNFSYWTRSLISIPSSLCDFLFILYIIAYLNQNLDRETQSVLIVGMILTHPFNGMIYFGIILLNRFLNLFFKNEKNSCDIQATKTFFNKIVLIVKANFKPFIIGMSMLAIWFIHLSIKYSVNWIDNYFYYFTSFNLNLSELFVQFCRNLTDDWISIRNIENLIVGEGSINGSPSGYFFNVTLHDLLVIPLLSLLIPAKKIYKTYKIERFIRFMKIFFIFLSFLWFLQVFYNLELIHQLLGSEYLDHFFGRGFYFVYKKRFLIIIALPSLVLFIHFLHSNFVIYDKIARYLATKISDMKREKIRCRFSLTNQKRTISAFILILMVIAQSDAIIKVYHFIPKSYTQTSFDFREHIDNSPTNNSILIDRDDYALYITFKSFLQDDQSLHYEYLDVNDTIFNNYLSENSINFDYVVISSKNQNYQNFVNNSSTIGSLIFNTGDIAILEINA